MIFLNSVIFHHPIFRMGMGVAFSSPLFNNYWFNSSFPLKKLVEQFEEPTPIEPVIVP